MASAPEEHARQNIDALLTAAGWVVQDRKEANPLAATGVAIGEFPMKSGYGEADYLLYVDGMVVGVVEAKKQGSTLTGVELQNRKYSEGVPDGLPAPRKPLPFLYESINLPVPNAATIMARTAAIFTTADVRNVKAAHRD